MKEAYGGTWLFQLVILFVLLFTGYMCLSINYTRAFDVKDKIINEIERNGGLKTSTNKDNALGNIVNYMKKVGYRAKGKCGKDFEGGVGCKRNGECVALSESSNSNYAFCVKEVKYDNVGSSLYDFYKTTDEKDQVKDESGEVTNPGTIISVKLYGEHTTPGEFMYLSYYKIKVFYKLDLPIIGQMFNFNILGDTKTLYKISNTK